MGCYSKVKVAFHFSSLLIVSRRDGGALAINSHFSSVRTCWKCVCLSSPYLSNSVCTFQRQQRVNLHDISATKAHFVIVGLCPCGALKKREILLSRGKMSFSICDKHFCGTLYIAEGFLATLKHVAAVSGNAHLSEPPLQRLQVNRGKLYANVTFS